MKKKVLALALAAVMALSLAACGSSGSSSTAGSSASAAGSSASSAASGEKYKIGICQLMQHDALDAATCSTIVTGFVANDYDLIMANATPALQAAISATSTIPILGTSVTDYATALADDSMDATVGTGINVSGTSDGVPAQLYADLVLELIPDAKNVSILYCSAEANSVLQAQQFEECMDAAGVTCSTYTFADSNDMQAVVTSAIEGADALYIPTDNTAASNMTIVANVCQPAGVPVICGEEGMCSNGGLATVSISYYDIGYLCGQMAVDVLNGADVSTMPIGYSENPVKKYNADYADAIGFTMPDGFDVIG